MSYSQNSPMRSTLRIAGCWLWWALGLWIAAVLCGAIAPWLAPSPPKRSLDEILGTLSFSERGPSGTIREIWTEMEPQK
jgi:hypothetical protein